jgi:ABC-type sugar transport system substrate-binding protein
MFVQFRRPKRLGAAVVALLVLAAMAVLAGCGGGGSSGGGGGGTETEAETGDASAESAGLTEAKQVVEKYLQTPKLTVTEPVGKPIPSGKTIDYVHCAPESCLEFPESFKEAGEVLGWQTKLISAGPEPGETQAAMEQAVRDHPDAVVTEAITYSIIAKQIKELKAMGIPVILTSVAEDGGDGVTASVNNSKTGEALGEIAAAWIANDMGGEGTVGYIDVPAFTIYGALKEKFESKLSEYCPKCKIDTYDMPITAIGKDAATRTLNFVRANSDIKDLFIVQDTITLGLPSALKAAGISDVKILGAFPTEPNLPYIAAEQEAAALPGAYKEGGWLMADATARIFAGVSTAPDESPTAFPEMIWDAENLPSETEVAPVVPNYKEEFEKLWGK